MIRTIRWKRDICGEDPELFINGEPTAALPQSGEGDSQMQKWTCPAGQVIQVLIQNGSAYRPYVFIDIRNNRTVCGIPRDVFDFIDSTGAQINAGRQTPSPNL